MGFSHGSKDKTPQTDKDTDITSKQHKSLTEKYITVNQVAHLVQLAWVTGVTIVKGIMFDS